jgi:hypothetical protein
MANLASVWGSPVTVGELELIPTCAPVWQCQFILVVAGTQQCTPPMHYTNTGVT